jgi:hypothetical protein
MESVLTTIKKMLGITADCKSFDTDIIIHINTVLLPLSQIGVGPEIPVYVKSDLETWDTVLGDHKDLEAVKTYIYLRVRLLFDPPSGGAFDAMKRQADELEWRLNVQTDLE